MRSFGDSVQSVAVTLSSDGLVTSVSSEVEQVTGYSPHELMGRPITLILADRSVFDFPQMMEAAREWGHWEGVLIHQDRSGRALEAKGKLSSLTGPGNSRAGFLLVSILIGKAVLSTAENAVQQEIAARLRMFSHELNNPLAVIMGFMQLILLSTQCTGKVRADLEKLYSELSRMVRVVEKLHSYALSLQREGSSEQLLDTMVC